MIHVARIERFESALVDPIGGARNQLSSRSGLVVTLSDDEGRAGFGEASPLPGTSLETLADVEHALSGLGSTLEDALARAGLDSSLPCNLSPSRVAACVEQLEDVARAPAARFAVETAMADLAARSAGLSVADWLSGGRSSTRIERSVLLGSLSRNDLVSRAMDAVARGARTLKIKVAGEDPARETADLLELRRVLASSGHAVKLRLDLNGVLDVESARAAVAAYARAEIELCEEPTGGEGLLALGRLAVPWFADESLLDPALRQRLLATPECAGFVLKPTLLGLFGARSLALAAFEAGKDVIITHTFDGPIALAAAAELALSLPRAPRASGLDRHPGLQAFPEHALAQLLEARAGEVLTIAPSPRVGIGVDWNSAT